MNMCKYETLHVNLSADLNVRSGQHKKDALFPVGEIKYFNPADNKFDFFANQNWFYKRFISNLCGM